MKYLTKLKFFTESKKYIKKYEAALQEFLVKENKKLLEHLIEILIKSGCTTAKYYTKLSNRTNENVEIGKMIYYEELPIFDIFLRRINNQFYIKIDNRFSDKNEHIIAKSFIEYLETINHLHSNSDMIGVHSEYFRILDPELAIKEIKQSDLQNFINMNKFNL